ncbi:MAG TPA: LytTR family DNA-binding domain-containing protein [Rhizobiaceae bacterium]|nr:LytTR family DNA-binding domain-containing protein [Rhizobiaceae bacterium]
MREFHLSPRLRRILIVDSLIIVLMTVTGPFGTYNELSAPVRFAYWAAAIGGCGLLFHITANYLLGAAWLANWPRLPRLGLAAILAAIPAAGLIGLIEVTLRGAAAPDHYHLIWFWLCITLIYLPLGIVHFVIFEPPHSAPAAGAEERPADSPFLDRLPRELGRELISLSMQDHYALATTARGSAMILIRFADAVRELASYPGAQIHRSHWVARGYAVRIARDGKRTLIELTDGRRLPVSRPYLEDARTLISERPATASPGSTARAAPGGSLRTAETPSNPV